MTVRRVTQSFYDSLLDLFRQKPGVYSWVAKHAGCNHRTALRAWQEGWPRLGFGPIRDLLLQEQAEARARLLRAEAEMISAAEQARKDAREQAIRAREAEGKILFAGRESTLAALAATRSILIGMVRPAAPGQPSVVDKAISALQSQGQVSPGEVIDMVDRVSRAVQRAVYAGQKLQEMQVMHLGHNTEMAGDGEGSDVSPAQAVEELQALLPALERARQLGLHVLEGGGGGDDPPDGPSEPSADAETGT